MSPAQRSYGVFTLEVDVHSLALLSPNQIFNFYFLKSVAKNFVMLFFSRLMERNDLLVEFLFFFF